MSFRRLRRNRRAACADLHLPHSIGCPSPKDASLWHAVFDTQMFRVHPVEDVAGVSLSGALKNVSLASLFGSISSF